MSRRVMTPCVSTATAAAASELKVTTSCTAIVVESRYASVAVEAALERPLWNVSASDICLVRPRLRLSVEEADKAAPSWMLVSGSTTDPDTSTHWSTVKVEKTA